MIIDVTGILSFLYVDKCDVYRVVEIVEDGITRHERTMVAEGLVCQLDTNETVPTGEDAYQLNAQYTVYFKPDVNIQKGDELNITSESGDVYLLYAGMPKTYVGSHKEVLASDKQYV